MSRPPKARAWFLASRPRTLPAAAAPVVVGTAVADHVAQVAWAPALAALGGALAIQIGTNFANDVFDFEQGADGEDRIGPTRAVAAGWLSPGEMRVGMIAAFAVATAFGAYLVAVAGWPIVAIGVASILSGIFYTATRHSIGYLGLGDLFVLIFFGFVAVGGTALVQVGRWPELALWAAVPVGAWATNIIVVNNLRDRISDARAHKRTLAVRFGRSFVLGEYAALALASYAVPVALFLSGNLGAAVLLPLLTLPAAVWLFVRLSRADGPGLNPFLGGTAQMMLLHAATFAVGLAWG
jgi:1,4-dihydroxy-2-naphthoate octaprenyltransferase